MLVLSRKLQQEIIIEIPNGTIINGTIIKIKVIEIERYKVRLGIEAPKEVLINRPERKTKDENHNETNG